MKKQDKDLSHKDNNHQERVANSNNNNISISYKSKNNRNKYNN